jgi:crossover junction endonuclease EME1
LEKSRKRQEREEIKAAKAADKQRAAALAEVNKLRTDKKVSTAEMIVELPSGLSSELRNQVQEMLQGLGVEHSTWSSPEHTIVKWQRKVTCRFNDDLGLWEPVPPRLVHENVALLILTAEEFVAMVLGDTLESHITEIKRRYGHMKLVYIIQGLTPWLRKNRNNRNRQFASDVRNANGPGNSSTSRTSVEHVPEDKIEDALLAVQVEHEMLIHHTTVAIETAKWVINFTQHVSTIPYKKQRDQATSVAGFCMESGQVRTGDGVQDTYVRMLQEIVRVTAPIAYGIATEFGSVTKLVQGLERGGPGTLDVVRKSTNTDGAVSDRTIGQAISRRMHKVFTGRDEESTDV